MDPALVPLLAQRCVLSHLTPPKSPAEGGRLTLSLAPPEAEGSRSGIPLDAQRPEWGTFVLQEERVLARIAPDPFAAEAALRAALLVAFLRQGGVLLHAAGVAFSTGALVIVGPSGAGKSTLARSAVAAGGALLSDETVGLLPSGLVHGSPFRSDPDMVPVLAEARLVRLAVVVKGAFEATEPLPAAEAARVVLQQAYRPPPGLVGLGELVARVGVWVERVGVHRFICRKDPAAGVFAREWVEQAPVDPGPLPRAS
ncbi:MAG: potassium transporter TrkH [Myxococcaceae bacterium]|nr:potassium transporter TrkH [Myxococcaceae bacterium]